jgi:hypothetical protein
MSSEAIAFGQQLDCNKTRSFSVLVIVSSNWSRSRRLFTYREISRYHSKLKSSQGGALWGFLRGLDQLFDADKRGLVVKLRDLELVEEFPGSDGRLRFAATKVLLQRFGLASLQELTAASLPASS